MACGPVLQCEIDGRHWTVTPPLQDHAMGPVKMRIDHVPTPSLRSNGVMGRQPSWHIGANRDGVHVLEDGPAETGAHCTGRSEHVNANETFDGPEQGHDRFPMIWRRGEHQHAIEVGQEEGR
tara:strand:- start:338 stop:703 length:366 start_codon:yes stop_codon:yes gene_type:complete